MKGVEINDLFTTLFTTDKRDIDVWGGRGRGGSHHASLRAILMLRQAPYYRGAIMRNILSDIRDTIWKECLDRIDELSELFDYDFRAEFIINDSSMRIRHIASGNELIAKGFKKSSGSQTAKLKGFANFTEVTIDEANEVDEDDFIQLQDTLRTKRAAIKMIRVFNAPEKSHYIWKDYILHPAVGYDRSDGTELDDYFTAEPRKHIHSIFGTYKDNIDNIDKGTVARYEGYHFTREDYYWNQIIGLIPSGKTGRIYKNWNRITLKEYQEIDLAEYYGLDFGFSAPAAMLGVKYHNGSLYVDLKHYGPLEYGYSYTKLLTAEKLTSADLCVCDSATPTIISDLISAGFYAAGAQKGPGSVNRGIKFLQSLNIFVTERSEKLWDEYLGYVWELDRNKEPTDKPLKKHDHAMDALRYIATFLKQYLSIENG